MEATLAFHGRVLGARVIRLEAWREGRMPVVGLIVGAHRMNGHARDAPGGPRAKAPTPGAGDLCFRWVGGEIEANGRWYTTGNDESVASFYEYLT